MRRFVSGVDWRGRPLAGNAPWVIVRLEDARETEAALGVSGH